MTRFLISLDEAIDLVHQAMWDDDRGYIYARRSPAATVAQMVRVMAHEYPTRVIGTRPGEKWHEHLVLPHESASECGDYFLIGQGERSGITYSSEHAPRVTDEALRYLIDTAPTDDL